MGTVEPIAPLPILTRVALAYAPARTRACFAAVFALDARLANAVLGAKEPLMVQLRLAYLREQLGIAGGAQDHELAELHAACGQPPEALVGLVDGWEMLLDDGNDRERALEEYADGRGEAFAWLARRANGDARVIADAREAGRCWALADLAGQGDRWHGAMASRVARRCGSIRPMRLPRALRPLKMLGELGRRALAEGRPLVPDRRRLASAIRIGMVGR